MPVCIHGDLSEGADADHGAACSWATHEGGQEGFGGLFIEGRRRLGLGGLLMEGRGAAARWAGEGDGGGMGEGTMRKCEVSGMVGEGGG